MGMSAFNRNRLERKPVEMEESARFEKWNADHQNSRLKKDRRREDQTEEQAALMESEYAAAERIGKKAEDGLETAVADFPLRADHAVEIAGRDLKHDPQAEPKTSSERLEERLPESERPREADVAALEASPGGPNDPKLPRSEAEDTEVAKMAKSADPEKLSTEARDEARDDEKSADSEKSSQPAARAEPAKTEPAKTEPKKPVLPAAATAKTGSAAPKKD